MFESTGDNVNEIWAKIRAHGEKAMRIIESVYRENLEEFKRIELANAGFVPIFGNRTR